MQILSFCRAPPKNYDEHAARLISLTISRPYRALPYLGGVTTQSKLTTKSHQLEKCFGKPELNSDFLLVRMDQYYPSAAVVPEAPLRGCGWTLLASVAKAYFHFYELAAESGLRVSDVSGVSDI